MTNVLPFQTPEFDLHDEILAELGGKKARGIEIDVYEVVDLIDVSKNYSKVRDWLIKERIATKYEWNKALEYKKRKDALGGDVQTPTELLSFWIKNNDIAVDYKSQIKQKTPTRYKNENVEEEIRKVEQQIAACSSITEKLSLKKTLALFSTIMDCKTKHVNVDDLARDLRIKAQELGFKFSALHIDDVIQVWLKEAKLDRKTDLFLSVCYQPGNATSIPAQLQWKKLCVGLFDTTDKSEEFCTAILKKFIWQIKRKMLNYPVSNHLMPILLGPQGIGKSTFISKLIAPLKEATASTDFSQITDDRNIDLWDNYALVLDEMGYASKADIDVVKNLVTSNSLTRRIMRSNNAIRVPQNATFIGSSNREIEQIIRDETGVRRFIGIRFSNEPNFEAMNSINYELLWQSVDEHGADPLANFKEELQIAQDESKVASHVEEWVAVLPKSFNTGKYMTASYLHIEYREWEVRTGVRRTFTAGEFSAELRRLINNTVNFPMMYRKKGVGWEFSYTG